MKKLYFSPAILMMVFIFCISSDSNSGQKSDFITTIILKVLSTYFFIPSNTINISFISFFIRKLAHISEYFILTLFFYIGFYKNFKNLTQIRLALFSLNLAVFYAITDEIHQTFVPNRVGSYKDVIIDSIGCIIFFFLIIKKSKHKHNN